MIDAAAPVCQNTFDRQCLRITASSYHVGRGDDCNPQKRISGSFSVLNLEGHLGLVISPQSPLSAGYITLRACRRSLPLRFSTVTPGGIAGLLIVSYPFNIPDRLVVHLSIHARPELRAHHRSHHRTTPDLARSRRTWDISAGSGHGREEALKLARTSKTFEMLMSNVSPIQR